MALVKAQSFELVTAYQRIEASDAAGSKEFGCSVSVDGDRIAVGARGADQVYIFEKSGGVWSEVDIIAGTAGEGFGQAVIVSGNTVFIGAPYAGSNAGAVYVYTYSGATWSLSQTITRADTWYAYLGWALAHDGDWLAIGIRLDTYDNVIEIHENVAGTWTYRQRMNVTGAGNNDWLGQSIAIANGVLVAGGPGQYSDGTTSGGAVWISEYNSGTGTWDHVVQFGNPDADYASYFGAAVAVSDDGSTIFVSSSNDDTLGTSAGVVDVLQKVTGTWTHIRRVPQYFVDYAFPGAYNLGNVNYISSGAYANGVAYFGASYAFAYEGMVLGVMSDSDFASDGYMQGIWYSPAPTTDAKFGISVDCDASTLVVGAMGHNGTVTDSGVAYIFEPFAGGGGADATAPTVSVVSPSAGSSIASDATMVVDVTDETELRNVVIMARYPTSVVDRPTETVWNGSLRSGSGSFLYPFLNSTRTAITGGHRYSITRTGGWKSSPTLDIVVVDAAGNDPDHVPTP